MRHEETTNESIWFSLFIGICFIVFCTLFFYAWNQHSKAIDAGQQHAKEVTLSQIQDPELEKVASQILASVDLTYCWQRKRDEVSRSGMAEAHLWATEKSKKAIQKSAELAFIQCYATRLLDMRTVDRDGVGDKLLDAMVPRRESRSKSAIEG